MSTIRQLRLVIYTLAISLLALMLVRISADEPTQLSEMGRKARLRKIRSNLEPFAITVVRKQGEEPAKLLDEPSLLYADNAREISDCSLWIWEFSGRPVGATAIEFHRNPTEAGNWTFEYASLADQKVRLTLGPNQTWTAEPAVITERPIAKAPEVAATRVLRAQQMKRLFERFSAIELHRTQGRIELRRLPTPVYRQSESSSGDGAIFVFAHGTNPEVVISIGTSASQPKVWTYALGAVAAEELFVTLDDQEVWRDALFTKPGARKSYINGRVPTANE